ncbi:uncharacterized protein LACBIDRAFT_329244 [Laccaria bicolor S238N-H82]|uniref:Predicted protein n=1 Tax=Laccaria bicolor (strain S238N-H82 / ATCC MYA-4686) TaxID=486041 RepID=B0DHH4_LACBS|nr:uncharacterized protein LACBIDRAFT_329244 [Laccaria bicolor S238N-H82]EDR06104.1 predicted protein [Laccaria bicolor S238N-H82]|eukprot:XP_001883392.1 predicted protein [Laccaria bicolor S238N-H82]
MPLSRTTTRRASSPIVITPPPAFSEYTAVRNDQNNINADIQDENPKPLRFEVTDERIAKTDPIWQHYVEVADEDDCASIETWNKDFDSLPIFSGLFATILTAFVLETYKELKPDQTQAIITTLQAGFNGLNNNGTSIFPPPAANLNFSPTARSVRVNGCFFVALAFTLMSASGAMISKVWCSEYGRRSTTGSPYQQALRRQWHYRGLIVFYYQEVLDFLPFLLYSAIMMFMVGICDWLYGIHKKIALYLILVFSFSFVFAVTLTFFSLVLPEYYPFRVPLADVIVRMAIKLFLKLKAKAETLVPPSWFPPLQGKSTKISLYKLFWAFLQTLWVFFELIWVALVMFPGFCRSLPQRCLNLYYMFLTFFAPRDAFGSAMARKPVDDSYSSLEVEALAWLVKASSQEKLENAHVLYDYNPALFAYHLSVHCVPFIVTFPAREAASYSIIMMQIIQCLCNNEAQLELGAQSQIVYGSFICSAMCKPWSST